MSPTRHENANSAGTWRIPERLRAGPTQNLRILVNASPLLAGVEPPGAWKWEPVRAFVTDLLHELMYEPVAGEGVVCVTHLVVRSRSMTGTWQHMSDGNQGRITICLRLERQDWGRP
jgi:hypothetical protein